MNVRAALLKWCARISELRKRHKVSYTQSTPRRSGLNPAPGRIFLSFGTPEMTEPQTVPQNRSLYREFKLVFILITICVTLAAIPAVVLTELSTGSGGAINVSGSLRMMSYKLTVAVSNPYETHEEREANTRRAVEEFWERLTRPGLLSSVPNDPADPIRGMYNIVAERFSSEIRPLALKGIDDEAARQRFMRKIGGFVDDVDVFVFALEERLSGLMGWLKAILVLTLLGALAVTFGLLRVMKSRIFSPLEELEAAAKAVREGSFDVRSTAAEHNSEIGRFARGFNFMVSELDRLYGSLEAEVAKKTADLNRRNQGLQFLAQASEQLLVDGPKLPEAVEKVLEGAAQLTGANGAAFCVSADPQKTWDDGKSWRFAETPGDSQGREGHLLNIPAIGVREETLGMLKIWFPEEPSAWQSNFLGMTAALIGRAVDASLRTMDERRLAVLEERSTIARELHDSIAQSLSFSKIQLLRLKRAIEADPTGDAAREVLIELDEGISTAYRQLREVLTAFRLQLQGTGFGDAVNAAVDAFRNRTGMPVSLTNTLLGVEISTNDQVHFIQILREALSNIEKHARATQAAVRIETAGAGGCILTVTDNGVGIPEHAEKARHFGLGIMKERAEALGAAIEVARRPEGGTVVRVEKKPVMNPQTAK